MGSLELQVGELIRLAAVSAGKAELTDVAFVGTGRALAAGTGDDTEVQGATIDRLNRESLVVGVAFSATLAAAENLKLRVQRELSVNGTDWTGAADVYADAIVAVGGAGGSTVSGVLEVDQDFLHDEAKQYVRYNVTPTLSAPATDAASWGAVFVLGSASVLPVV